MGVEKILKKKILITAYDVDPFKGSESITGWSIPLHIDSEKYDITVITRENNLPNIKKRKLDLGVDITFLGFDLPLFLRFWKKGGRGAMIYFYLWQMCIPLYIFKKNLKFDLVHALNFHCDYIPHFLWVFGKPSVWGPISHHEPIPFRCISEKASNVRLVVNEGLKNFVKTIFYTVDPFLFLCKKMTSHTFIANTASEKRLRPVVGKYSYLNQIASDDLLSVGMPSPQNYKNELRGFHFCFMGRLVPLKAPDVVVEAFALLLKRLGLGSLDAPKLIFIGDGDLRSHIRDVCTSNGISDSVVVTGWLNRDHALSFLSQADVFVFPSHEGGGLVLSEAASLGLPVICLDNQGAGSVLAPSGAIKIKVSSREEIISELAAAMHDTFIKTSLRKELSQGVRRNFVDQLSWESKGRQISAVYDRLLS